MRAVFALRFAERESDARCEAKAYLTTGDPGNSAAQGG
jgi:hypothetical protein